MTKRLHLLLINILLIICQPNKQAFSDCQLPSPAPPMQVRRAAEFYLLSQHYHDCHVAAHDLLSVRMRSGKYDANPPPPGTPARQNYEKLIVAYERACLFSLEAANSRRILGPTLML
jgi:hypothetical protein